MKNEELVVKVKFNGNEAEFSGGVDDVTRLFLKFLTKHYPALKVVSNLVLTVDLEELLDSLKGVLAISEGEVIVLTPKEELSDRENILLLLLKRYVENKLGFKEDSCLTVKEIVAQSGESKKTISGRLSELVSGGMVKRVERGKYRVTAPGIRYFVENVLPELR